MRERESASGVLVVALVRGEDGRLRASSQAKVEDYCGADNQKEGVGLKITRLQQAQNAAEQFGSAVRSPNDKASDQPAVDPSGGYCQRLLSYPDEPLIEFIDIKPMAQ